MERSQKRTGRPPKEPAPGSRVSLGLKVTPEIKLALDKAAKDNGRTQSQEAEYRLQQSFRNESLLPDILDTAYGEQTAGVLLLLTKVMQSASLQAGFRTRDDFGDLQDWLNNPYAFQQVERAISRALEELRPMGDPDKTQEAHPRAAPDLGKRYAAEALHQVGLAATGSPAPAWANPVAQRLGEIILQLDAERNGGSDDGI